MLFELMSKVVLGAGNWAGALPPEAMSETIRLKEGKTQ